MIATKALLAIIKLNITPPLEKIHQIWLANGLLLLHALVVGITVAGAIALFTGRFARFHKKDFFAWSFIVCAFGQIISLVLTGGCILTAWEREIRLQSDPSAAYSKTFLKEYMPFLPEGIIHATPFLTVAALIGAFLQIRLAFKLKPATDPGEPPAGKSS